MTRVAGRGGHLLAAAADIWSAAQAGAGTLHGAKWLVLR